MFRFLEEITEDLQGYLEAGEDPACKTESFDLNGNEVTADDQ